MQFHQFGNCLKKRGAASLFKIFREEKKRNKDFLQNMASNSAPEPVKKVQLEGKVIAITGANRGKKRRKKKDVT